MPDRIPIAIIGGGWAGLAAAMELAEAGLPVTLLESAKQLGGRARTVSWDGLLIDNGQHLMIGAYTETLRLMQRLGTLPLLEQRRLNLRVPGFQLHLPDLPAPLHLATGLLKAKGLSLGEKLAATRFIQNLKKRGFQLAEDRTVVEILAAYGQPESLTAKLWAPMCVAALNTPLDLASAQIFCNVLRDSLAGPREASDLIFNRAAMGALLPEAAVDYVVERGGIVRTASKVEGIAQLDAGFLLSSVNIHAERTILAVHPSRVTTLTSSFPALSPTCKAINQFAWEPILTLWLRFATPVQFPFPMLGLGEGQAPWAFERNDIVPGLVSVVVSAHGPHLDKQAELFRDECLALLAAELGPLPHLLNWKTVVEKRATFACTPKLARPDNSTPVANLYLAGDYTAGDYPATLEGAVRSGVKCAHLILDRL